MVLEGISILTNYTTWSKNNPKTSGNRGYPYLMPLVIQKWEEAPLTIPNTSSYIHHICSNARGYVEVCCKCLDQGISWHAVKGLFRSTNPTARGKFIFVDSSRTMSTGIMRSSSQCFRQMPACVGAQHPLLFTLLCELEIETGYE